MALSSCLYFRPDIDSERIWQISQTRDCGRQFVRLAATVVKESS